ncbi:MAG: hypothetical protein V1915_04430 [Candidatus Bathyarchaeota archaeon]
MQTLCNRTGLAPKTIENVRRAVGKAAADLVRTRGTHGGASGETDAVGKLEGMHGMQERNGGEGEAPGRMPPSTTISAANERSTTSASPSSTPASPPHPVSTFASPESPPAPPQQPQYGLARAILGNRLSFTRES